MAAARQVLSSLRVFAVRPGVVVRSGNTPGSFGVQIMRTLTTSKPALGGGETGQWGYRADPPPLPAGMLRRKHIQAELMMTFMWFWFLWHLFTEPEHLTGHYHPPDPSKFTDEELGIPADDA